MATLIRKASWPRSSIISPASGSRSTWSSSPPWFAGVDNRLTCLQLIERAFTDTALFTAQGEVVQPAEALDQRPILVERGRFRPVNLLSMDLPDKGLEQFRAEPELVGEEPIELMELTLRDLHPQQGVDKQDFLDRVDILGILGKTVLISNHGPYHGLVEDFSRYTQKKVGIALGVPALLDILDDTHDEGLRGGRSRRWVARSPTTSACTSIRAGP